jgi:light-regulated signal transduction histidine kinase (bacteriophytochrome)
MTPSDRIPVQTMFDRSREETTWDVPADALRRELERLTARIVQLEREKADVEAFAAVAAHELVEPLVMAEAYAAIVSDRLGGPEHEDSRRDLDTLSRGMARMRLLAESLLYDARSSERALDLETVSMAQVTADCLALLRPEVDARGASVDIGELPDVLGEPILLGGVMSNLLVNALKYSPRQNARIQVSGNRHDGVCRFAVDSEGPTIAPEARARIFEAYERGPGERRAVGAGLGLAICKRIVLRHGGEIGVTDIDGAGNRFHFTLPAA